MTADQESQFVATYRLSPAESFKGVDIHLELKDVNVFVKADLAWLQFEAPPDQWSIRLQEAAGSLRTILAILTIQVEYPFEVEAIQWIEDKRAAQGQPSYVLGNLRAGAGVQAPPPLLEGQHFAKGAIYAHIAIRNPYYLHAVLDYASALAVPSEAIVFHARSVEWLEHHFKNQAKLTGATKVDKRALLRQGIKLKKAHLEEFFKIANETVIARHAGDPALIRRPTREEIGFCRVLTRGVIDRFAGHIWYEISESLPDTLKWPDDEPEPGVLFASDSDRLNENLGRIFSGELG